MTEVLHPSTRQLLSAIRHDLATVVGPELQSDMAKTVCRMAGDVLSYLLAREEVWPAIARYEIERKQKLVRRVQNSLSIDPPIAESSLDVRGNPELDTLSVRRLAQRKRTIDEILGQLAHAAVKSADSAWLGELIDMATESQLTQAKFVGENERAAHETYVAAQSPVTQGRLQRYFDHRFPARPGVTISEVHELAGGFGKTTVMFSVNGLEQQLIQLVLRRDRAAGATDTTVIDEYPLLQSLYRHGLPVPEPLWLETDSFLDHPFIVTRRVRGVVAGTLFGLDRNVCTAQTALDLARILAKLHGLAPATVNPATLCGSNTDDLGKLTALWQKTRIEPDPLMEACLCWLAQNRPDPVKSPCLVHSDPGCQNILVEGGRIVALLDWELSHLGDPTEDLSYVRPYVEQLVSWESFMEEYRRHGGGEFSVERSSYYDKWRLVRNSVYAYLCHRAFCMDANTDLRFAHTGVHYYPAMITDAARRIFA